MNLEQLAASTFRTVVLGDWSRRAIRFSQVDRVAALLLLGPCAPHPVEVAAPWDLVHSFDKALLLARASQFAYLVDVLPRGIVAHFPEAYVQGCLGRQVPSPRTGEGP